MTDRTTEEAKREAFKAGNEFAPYHPDASHVEPGYRDGWNACYRAALQWQAEQQKGEALPKIASEVRIMLGSATELFDGIGDIVGYQIKTGALHRILGLLSGAGHPVAIAAKNQSVALAASPHGVKPVAYLTRDEDGQPAMLFFDPVEAAKYCDEGAEPEALVLSSLPQAPQGEQE